ncbi:MAG TPA: EthD domain-containing protein [Acidimicrobiales bacterium]|nr:EthD domain-containing protein [Acidimicrobiales bacterium]
MTATATGPGATGSAGTTTAIVLVTPGPAWDLAVLRREVAARSAAAGDVRVEVVGAIDDGPDFGATWRAAVELHGPADAVDGVLAGLAGLPAGLVDAGSSAIVVGTDHTVFERPPAPAADHVRLYYALFRLPGAAQADFSAHWREVHGPAVLDSPYPRTYQQLHGDPDRTAAACRKAGFGVDDVAGIAHERFVSPDSLTEAVADTALDDERADVLLFSDGSRNRGVLTRPGAA